LAFSQGESLELAASLNTLSEIHSAKQSNELFVTGRSYLETGLSFTLKTDKSRWELFSNIGLISGASISDRIGDI